MSIIINWQARSFYIRKVFSLKRNFSQGSFQGKNRVPFSETEWVDIQSKATSRINYSARSNYSCYMLLARRTNSILDRHIR